MGYSVEDFFDRVLEDTKAGSKLPNWYVLRFLSLMTTVNALYRNGELYLEASLFLDHPTTDCDSKRPAVPSRNIY
jgi:hypothetical protein